MGDTHKYNPGEHERLKKKQWFALRLITIKYNKNKTMSMPTGQMS